MEQEQEGATDLAEQRDRLNRFKDREIFLIDLDHILMPGSDFREMSQRLTAVAENLVTTGAGVLSPAEYADLVGAYNFFRRLINALRMLHGSARDLVLPAIDSDEYLHLTRRMEYEPNAGATPAQQLHDEFADRTEFVRDFIRAQFDRPCP